MKRAICLSQAIILLITLAGCTPFNSKDNNLQKTSNSQEVSKIKQNRELELVAVKEATEKDSSPSKAAIHQYEFHFKDNSKSSPSKDSIVNEATLGNRSIVILNTQELDCNFAVFDYENEKNLWRIRSLITLDVKNGQYFKDKGGLKLPFEKFVVATSTDSNPEIWSFADHKNIVAVAKYKEFPFESSGINTLTSDSGKRKYYSYKKNKKEFIFYHDSEYIVVISGNLAFKDMIKLADSLPTVSSANFPRNN
ncbi:hypothetical protein ACFWM3_00665 [Gottfriedia sp. NPDC058432]|uniref:hypothetical protein n=1 Tax=Gottfriedia sp. NPDC058432 TaxID=3346497 RepID=UPI003654917A